MLFRAECPCFMIKVQHFVSSSTSQSHIMNLVMQEREVTVSVPIVILSAIDNPSFLMLQSPTCSPSNPVSSTNPFVATLVSLTTLPSRALRRKAHTPSDAPQHEAPPFPRKGKMKEGRSLTLPPLRFEGRRKNLGVTWAA